MDPRATSRPEPTLRGPSGTWSRVDIQAAVTSAENRLHPWSHSLSKSIESLFGAKQRQPTWWVSNQVPRLSQLLTPVVAVMLFGFPATTEGLLPMAFGASLLKKAPGSTLWRSRQRRRNGLGTMSQMPLLCARLSKCFCIFSESTKTRKEEDRRDLR